LSFLEDLDHLYQRYLQSAPQDEFSPFEAARALRYFAQMLEDS